ncbi:uncharacterized protein K460DRAFT_335427 [Cucurbitaria berberidis CBS 394.84]|uniref:F-box domain-containing protein n=1 Tax=Cucurbitaria berberidis CBS 394.84 TaxID=1168544 RepID=A0A9P4GFF5_9PLEO|nr:uncharacterized protein K460DRAFT_335427 [Cucurbitaria berberidis CBS 394.84]KAF1844575.1 hypothetical protein K460DRAFT_335427 [Cucurbitaria berberidis CBS 394.84]
MAALSPESEPRARFGTHRASMPLEALPPELWHLIIMFLDDHCFVWSVLRQVSPFLTSVTEDVFARYILRTCSLRFAGETLRKLLPYELQTPDPVHGNGSSLTATSNTYWAIFTSLNSSPTIRFQPVAFIPANTKARVVLKLSDLATQSELVPVSQEQATTTTTTTHSSHCLAHHFFRPGANADVRRGRLINEPHFVRFNNQLKSIRIPSLTIDIDAQEISLDWRQLCKAFLHDEFRCRFETNSLGSWSLSLGRNNP